MPEIKVWPSHVSRGGPSLLGSSEGPQQWAVMKWPGKHEVSDDWHLAIPFHGRQQFQQGWTHWAQEA